METEKLYYQDAYMTDFTAHVTECVPYKDAWRVALDRTAFYPDGGGQPADHGKLRIVPGVTGVSEEGTVPDGANVPEGETIPVLDVHEREGVVWHTCPRPIPVGTAVAGRIDWERRFDHMQQHSGEHILSGILCRRYDCDNVGFHLGADTVTIDYNTSITWEQALDAEREANAVVWADRAVEITWPSPSELDALSYRSKKELSGAVRIVTFPEADRCACCGTHVARAGQAGPIKILSCQKFREGVRLEILCGRRAFSYLSRVWEAARSAGQRLSVKPEAVAEALIRMEEEHNALKERAAQLEEECFAAIARENAGAGNVLLFREAMRPDSVRRLADAVARQCGGIAAAFAGSDGAGYAYALVRAPSDGETTDKISLGLDVKAMNAALHGRGGGRGGFAQGSVQAARTEIEAYFHRLGDF